MLVLLILVLQTYEHVTSFARSAWRLNDRRDLLYTLENKAARNGYVVVWLEILLGYCGSNRTVLKDD